MHSGVAFEQWCYHLAVHGTASWGATAMMVLIQLVVQTPWAKDGGVVGRKAVDSIMVGLGPG
jgi:hypothetical protein